MYEIWRQRNPESRMYMDAKKLMNQKNYIMKHNKITEMEIEEIKKELQANQRSHLEESRVVCFSSIACISLLYHNCDYRYSPVFNYIFNWEVLETNLLFVSPFLY